MCIVSTVSSLRVVGNVSVRGVNKVELRKKKNRVLSNKPGNLISWNPVVPSSCRTLTTSWVYSAQFSLNQYGCVEPTPQIIT